MKEEKRKTFLAEHGHGPQALKSRPKSKQSEIRNNQIKGKVNLENRLGKTKIKTMIKRIGTKQAIKSFNVEVIQAEHNRPNLSRIVETETREQQVIIENKENWKMGMEFRNKLKRVGKKVWVTAYKQNVQDQQLSFQLKEQNHNLLNPFLKQEEGDFSDFKQYSRGSYQPTQNGKTKPIQSKEQQMAWLSPAVIQQIRYVSTQVNKQNQNVIHQGNSNQINQKSLNKKQWTHRSIKQYEISNLESIHSCQSNAILDGQLNKQIKVMINNDQKIMQDTNIDIDKMLQQIDNDHSQMNYSKYKKVQDHQKSKKILLQIPQQENHDKDKDKLQSDNTPVSTTDKTFNSKNEFAQLQSGPALAKKIKKRTLEPRQSLLRKFQLQNMNNIKSKKQIVRKKQSISLDIAPKQLPFFSIKNSKKPLVPINSVNNQKQLQTNQNAQKINYSVKVEPKLQKQSSVNTVLSNLTNITNTTDSKGQVDYIKTTQITRKQIQNKFQSMHHSLHHSTKKDGARKIGIQKLKNLDVCDQFKMGSSLKKNNFKHFQMNRCIAQAKRQIERDDLIR